MADLSRSVAEDRGLGTDDLRPLTTASSGWAGGGLPGHLLALQRAAGNRAVAAAARNARVAVQRKVGFEFETDMLTAAVQAGRSRKKLRQDNTGDYQSRAYLDVAQDSPLVGQNAPFKAMNKKDPIINHRGDPFTAEADEDVDSGKSNLEYVTKPFDDTPEGEAEMRSTMTTIVAMHSDVLDRATKAGGTVPVKAKELSKYGTPTDGTALLAASDKTNATVQASVGLRLDRVADLMRLMGGIQPGEAQNTTTQMAQGRAMLGKGTESPGGVNLDDTNVNITGAAPRFATTALIQTKAQNHKLWALTPTPTDRAKLIGIMSLAVQYVVTAPSVATYPKVMAPLMARTDFVGLFEQLRDSDKNLLRKNNGQLFVDLVMAAVAMRGGNFPLNAPLIPNVYSDNRFAGARQAGHVSTTMLAGLTRDVWLRGIPAGTDYLTADHFLTAAPNAPAHTEEHIESMGHLHGHTDPVGQGRQAGSVFEIRTAGGRMNYRFWYSHAADIFKYILELNNGRSPVIQNSVLKLSQDDNALYQRILGGDGKALLKALDRLTEDAQQGLQQQLAV